MDRAVADTPIIGIDVSGVEGKMLDNVKAALTPPPGVIRDGAVNMPWLERFVYRIPQNVKKALKPFGYYHAKIKTGMEKTDNGYTVRVKIEPGNPTLLTDVKISVQGPGAQEDRLKDFAGSFPLKKGDILNHSLYESGKARLRQTALDMGFQDADYTVSEIRVSLERFSARIELVLDTGPRYFFGNIDIKGGDIYPDAFLRRYLALERGGDFSYEKIYKTKLNFINSDRFRETVIIPHKDRADALQIPVTIRLTPSPPKRLRFGIGYGTDTGPRTSVHYRDLNVFGKGHEIYSDLILSESIQSWAVDYRLPGRNIDSFTGFQANLRKENVSSYKSEIASLEANRTRDLGNGMIGTAYVRLQKEDSTVGEQTANVKLVLPGLRFSIQHYDNLIRPRRGYRYVFELRGTESFLGSDVGLVQVMASGKLLFPLPWQLTATLRTQGALSYERDPLSSLPASLRFFTGGDNSVRGYAYQSLGPTDSNGTVVGGRHLLVGGAEIERALPKNWAVAAFYDTGNAFNNLSDINLFQSIGMGVRYYTPVGAIRLDVARQIDVDDPSFRIHFSLGFQL
ncbi:MAG: outer membrane protein assembly factor [Deltaproteobacteria bacterium]|nr:outer membrane protein assembly factor [Deltaproteobacteria bacterium]